MQFTPIYLESQESQKLLLSVGTSQADAALLYLYIRNGNTPRMAKADLGFTEQRLSGALATLRQQGLYNIPQPQETKPHYGELDVLNALQEQMEFKELVTEAQHRLGRVLSVEDLKILLNISNYLGLPNQVTCVLISYMTTRSKQKGYIKPPSLYQIEKVAYKWADEGIDTLEAAFDYIHKKDTQESDLGRLMQILQIHGRTLTPPEEKTAKEWLQLGIGEGLIRMAYEKACEKTGGLNWAYMNKVLHAWHQEGYRTPDDVKSRRKKQRVPTGASGTLGEAEIEAIQRMMAMDTDDFLACRK